MQSSTLLTLIVSKKNEMLGKAGWLSRRPNTAHYAGVFFSSMQVTKNETTTRKTHQQPTTETGETE